MKHPFKHKKGQNVLGKKEKKIQAVDICEYHSLRFSRMKQVRGSLDFFF